MGNTTLHRLFKHYVGIDISKRTLDLWLRPLGQSFSCSNDRQGFTKLHQWLLGQGCTTDNTVVCFEHMGVYGSRLWAALSGFGWACAVEKTTILEKVGPEHHRKDDRFDAELLAEYADRFSDRLHITPPPEQHVDILRQLYGERRRLVTQQGATLSKQAQARQQTHSCELLQQGWAGQLELLESQIKALEVKIRQVIAEHRGLKACRELLLGIPGVGRVTASLWLVLFYGQEKLNPKKIASRFGFAPHSRRSGSSVRGKTRSSGHGHSEMRRNMALAARSVSTHYEQFKDYKHRKQQEGKCWGIIRNNLINKLIKIICAIWNSRKPYDPNFISRFDRQKNAAYT